MTARIAITGSYAQAIFAECVEKGGGSYAALGKRLGISPQAIYKWQEIGIPLRRVLAVEAATGIPRERLRPDIFRQQHAPHNASRSELIEALDRACLAVAPTDACDEDSARRIMHLRDCAADLVSEFQHPRARRR